MHMESEVLRKVYSIISIEFTSRDIIFNEENIEFLSDGVCKLVYTIHLHKPQ